jgi:catechol-2,3-dioxygenase
MSSLDNKPVAAHKIRGLNHLTLPVRDRYKAARFYVAVLGGEITHETSPDSVKQGLARAAQIGVQIAPGVQIDLFEQDYGQPNWDQGHPHIALDVSAEALAVWKEHLSSWGVPSAGPIQRGKSPAAELYFTDPDGNHLECCCSNYPDRASLPMGPYDPQLKRHQQPWPSKDREAEADRLLAASLERMRSRQKAHGK